MDRCPKRKYQDILQSTEINETKVEKAINALNPCKSQEPDNVHPEFLKDTKDQLTKPLKITQ